jgi:short-subunit dehydrogenase
MGTALITGASSGIGLDLARLFANDKHDLVLVARNESALGQVARECRARHGVKVVVLPQDLSHPSAPDEIFAALGQQGVAIDFLVNNAGFGAQGAFAKVDLKTHLDILQVNVVALTHLTRLFLPGMVGRGRGRILNVASTAAFAPGPYMSVYYASKAYVLSQSVALARELRHTGVTVTALCPGPTKTAFQERANMGGAKLFRAGMMTSEAVALAGYRGFMRGKSFVIPGAANKASAWAGRVVPWGLVSRVTASLNRGRE